MFQFPGFAHSYECSSSSSYWVPPFGDVRINSCLQIPGPFRSLPRPSSPPDSLGILRSLFFPFVNCVSRLKSLASLRISNTTHCRFFVNHESLDSFLLLPIEIVVHNLLYENSVFKVYRLTLSFALPLDYFFSVLSMN